MSLIRLPTQSVLLLITISPALLLIACSNEAQEQGMNFPPPAVSVAEVVVRDVRPWDEFHGRIEATQTVRIRPRVGGVIEKVHYREGDVVNKGDLLFTLDQRPFRAELERAVADLARTQAQAKLSSVERQRAKTLVERKLFSQDDFDQRLTDEEQANANVRSAQAMVKLARLNMGYTKIRSPINGRTGQALVTRGNLVSSDPTPDLLTTVVSLNPVYVYFDSDELSYLRYSRLSSQLSEEKSKKKNTVLVGLSDEKGFSREGFVDFIDNQVDATTGTIRQRAVLENKDNRLRPGMFARVKLLGTESESTMLIDDKAIMTDQDRKYIYVLGPKNEAMRRDISIGRAIEGLRIIKDGLQPGDQVIVHGIQKVFFPGMPVAPQQIVMGDPPSASPSVPPSLPESDPATDH